MLETTTDAASAMLIDRLMPDYDATRIEHLVMPGEIETVYAATRQADFLEAWRGSPAVRFLFAARGVGERAMALARRQAVKTPPVPDRLRLIDMTTHGDWVLLGEDPPHEVAFGVIGRFWAGETVWEQIDASDFETYDRPGRARIACSFSLRRYGGGRTLVSYECRTKGTDAESTSGFLRYWRALSPFIGVVLRAQLHVIANEVQR
jgi:hypothetical protein